MAHVKLVGLGLNKLSDKSKKMVFIGYESGTKGYRFFDPIANKLVVSRDVIFDEKQPWDWTNVVDNTGQPSDSFINYELSEENPTIGENAVEPGAEAEGGGFAEPQNTLGSNGTPAAQWATPPSNHSKETFGGPLRFRTLDDLFGSTDEV